MTITETQPAGAEVSTPQAAPRGRLLVLQGRGDAAPFYRRFRTRLAVDGYETVVPRHIPSSPDEVADAWRDALAGWPDETPRVIVAVDTAAGLVAQALADELLDPRPDAVVIAGLALPGEPPAVTGIDAELALRSACPVHRGVVLENDAESFADSRLLPTWPSLDGLALPPALAIHGEADRITDAAVAADALGAWPATEVVTVVDGLHDVLNDRNHRTVAAEIVAFLERLRLGDDVPAILRRHGSASDGASE